ncbi:hypothetical protein BJV82DRAFT_662540 [Fennellomyces sp. T-0311]|nr:hypothetical protein BJV82DRAFT_662540 [Fennellomyces sp. T-0311]
MDALAAVYMAALVGDMVAAQISAAGFEAGTKLPILPAQMDVAVAVRSQWHLSPRSHVTYCLKAHEQLGVPYVVLDPIPFGLNLLPTTIPKRLGTQRHCERLWPRLTALVFKVGILCHDEGPARADPAYTKTPSNDFLSWIDPRNTDSLTHPQADVANQFEENATDLLNEARTAAASGISSNFSTNRRKRKRSTEVQYHGARLRQQQQQQQVSAEDPFVDATPGDRVRSAIISFISKEEHVPEIHKQDLLYYGIIDRIATSATKLRATIASDDLEHIFEVADSCVARNYLHNTNQDQIKAFVEKIVQPVINVQTLQEAIKAASHTAKANTCASRTWQKKVVKLLKEVRDIYTDDGSSLLLQQQGELHYISTFLAPIIKKLFKGCDEISYMGDTALTASKEEEWAALKDDEARSRGKTPDGIFHLVGYGVDIALLEVSGPPNTANHQHHIGDRNKLAKSLKQLLKKIRRATSDGDTSTYESITLYGIQVYSKY